LKSGLTFFSSFDLIKKKNIAPTPFSRFIGFGIPYSSEIKKATGVDELSSTYPFLSSEKDATIVQDFENRQKLDQSVSQFRKTVRKSRWAKKTLKHILIRMRDNYNLDFDEKILTRVTELKEEDKK